MRISWVGFSKWEEMLPLLITLTAGFAFYYALGICQLLRLYKKPSLLSEIKISITDDGISRMRNDDLRIFAWKEILKVFVNDGFVQIIIRGNKKIFIPIRFFESEEKVHEFVRMIPQRIPAQNQNSKTGSHLYAWGLLGLIPNFGVVAGIILFYKGLFTYNNKKLIWIGAADVLLTILFWTVMNTYFMGDANTKLAEYGLNDLVKEIEFYKVKNGTYPGDLNDLSKRQSNKPTFDPFNNGNYTYHYIATRNKYSLFSVGPDKKPGSGDDIFPTVTGGDTVKFGWVRK